MTKQIIVQNIIQISLPICYLPFFNFQPIASLPWHHPPTPSTYTLHNMYGLFYLHLITASTLVDCQLFTVVCVGLLSSRLVPGQTNIQRVQPPMRRSQSTPLTMPASLSTVYVILLTLKNRFLIRFFFF